MNTSEEMYREEILDLYMNPHNFGRLKSPTHIHSEFNPLCGDTIKMELEIEKEKVKDVKFSGGGCALSIASASLLTDKIKNMPIREVEQLNSEDIINLMQIPIGPVRVKCVLLAFKTLQKA